jgi:hypothetical protein
MRGHNYREKDNIKAHYRNTRSKFYQKQASFDKDDTRNDDAANQQNTGTYWKTQGNDYFKAKNYAKAI